MNLPDDIELEWCFCALIALSQEISPGWSVVLRRSKFDEDILEWLVFPYEGDIADATDFSVAEEHKDRVTIRYKGGIMFARSTPGSIRSQWMASQLKNKPELAGRII